MKEDQETSESSEEETRSQKAASRTASHKKAKASVAEADKKGPPPPPRPIIGPDGKELVRPTDANGRPLPIYITPDGKPILDQEGRLMPLRFDKDGKPIPIPFPSDGPSSPPPPLLLTKPRLSNWVMVLGIVDFVLSLLIVVWASFMLYLENPDLNKTTPAIQVCKTTLIVGVLGAISDCLPIIAWKKNKEGVLYLWGGICLILLLVQGGGTIVSVGIGIAGTCHCLVRSLVICVLTVCSSDTGCGSASDQTRVIRGENAYPTNRTVIRQQPQTIVQPMMMQTPSYGYSYPMMGYGYRSPYYHGGMADAAMLGLVAGSMMHHDYYDYGWGGYDYGGIDGGYDGFF